MQVGIVAEGLTLSVPLYVQRERHSSGWLSMLLGAAFDPPRRRFTTLLEDMSFELRPGDRVALLGRNGAGKSTLLRVLNGVYVPTSGRLSVQGSCQALLNISLGFNGEATVRENVFLRGTAMGLRAVDLRTHVEEILSFADLGDKATHRLRTLSAGQRVRLGFAISTAFQHDIMLMDEWLGAGDLDFVAKAKTRLQGRIRDSKIITLASHSTGLLRDICNRGLVIERGRLVYDGDILDALECYHEVVSEARPAAAAVVDEAPRVPAAYGYVEKLDHADGCLRLVGWMVDTEGGTPSNISVDIDGVVCAVESLTRVDRNDVARHMALRNPACGFVASFRFPEFAELVGNGGSFTVYGGHAPEPADLLRLAAGVSHTLRSLRAGANFDS